MKTCKTGCGKMKAGGSVKKVKKMATGGQALNKARGFAKAQKGGDNVAKNIYGIPNAGTTGPNRTATYDYKKGGSIKKYPDGGSTKESKKKEPASNESNKKDPAINSAAYNKLFNSTQARDSANFYRAALKKEILTKGHSDKTTKLADDLQRQYNKGKKGYDKLGNPKGKFGMSVGVKASCKNGMVRGADGNCVMSRPKFQKGGSTYLGGPSGGPTPGTIIMRADKEARSKYFTPDNIRKEGINLTDKQVERKIKEVKDSLYNKYMKDAKLTPEKKSTTKKAGAVAARATKKMAAGGSLKPVPAGKVGLSKLPTAVRNKMGYQKKGGSVKK